MTTDPEKLKQDYCFALVGKFMFSFAVMESAINGAITRACSIGDLDAAIILANMETNRKLYILRSAVAVKASQWQKNADEVIKSAQRQLEVRNIVAHTVFGPTDDGKVKFLTVKAKSSLQYPDIKWSVQDFAAQYKKMSKLADGFKEIEERMTPGTSANILSNIVGLDLKAMQSSTKDKI